MDISNNQRQLFGVIDRTYLLDGDQGKPHDDGIRIPNYTGRIQANSYANYPHESFGQLDGGTHIGTFGKENSQPSKLPNPLINCTPRKNESASRFNYAYDRSIDKRMVDVSGMSIPNNMLRVMPNNGVQLCYQKRVVPANTEIFKLAQRIGNISASDLDKTFNMSESDLRFKIKNQKLTREELMTLGKGNVSSRNDEILYIPNVPQQTNELAGVRNMMSERGLDSVVNIRGGSQYLDLASSGGGSRVRSSSADGSRKRSVRGAGRPPMTRPRKI